jgi:hypothetical protein
VRCGRVVLSLFRNYGYGIAQPIYHADTHADTLARPNAFPKSHSLSHPYTGARTRAGANRDGNSAVTGIQLKNVEE